MFKDHVTRVYQLSYIFFFHRDGLSTGDTYLETVIGIFPTSLFPSFQENRLRGGMYISSWFSSPCFFVLPLSLSFFLFFTEKRKRKFRSNIDSTRDILRFNEILNTTYLQRLLENQQIENKEREREESWNCTWDTRFNIDKESSRTR